MRRALILLLLFLLPAQALAHAQLRASDPAEGLVVAAAPTAVTLTFNEGVSPLVLRHIAPDGAATDLSGSAQDLTVTVALPADLPPGTQLLSWRVVSSDGHPVGGTLTFHVGQPSTSPATPAEVAAGAAWIAASLRLVLTVALVGAVGTAVFAVLVARAPAAAPLKGGATLAAVATLPVGAALIAVQGLDLLSLPPAALWTAQPWQAGLAAPVAATVALSVVAAAMAAVALCATGPAPRVAWSLAAWGLAAVSFATSGHAAAAAPRALAVPAVTAHALALIFWTGALMPLLLMPHTPAADALLRRFSTLAIPLVALLVLSGATLTWLQAGSPAALAGSAYGVVLAAKLLLVAALLALAARNRLVLTPALAAGRANAAARLSRAIRAEVALAIAILALASALRLTPPPRALADPAPPLYAHIHADRAMADLRLTPGRAGPVEVALGFQTGDFAELVPQEVEVVLAQPAAGIEPIRLTARPGSDELWHAGPVTLPRPGDWDVTLRLLVTDFDRVTLTGTLTLPP